MVVFWEQLQVPFHFGFHLIILFVLDELVDQRLSNAGVEGAQGDSLPCRQNRLGVLADLLLGCGQIGIDQRLQRIELQRVLQMGDRLGELMVIQIAMSQ